MKILNIRRQSRRDFFGEAICEHCQHIDKDFRGYDDDNFHRNVIPKIECENCGKTSPSDYRPMGTKYPEGYQV